MWRRGGGRRAWWTSGDTAVSVRSQRRVHYESTNWTQEEICNLLSVGSGVQENMVDDYVVLFYIT